MSLVMDPPRLGTVEWFLEFMTLVDLRNSHCDFHGAYIIEKRINHIAQFYQSEYTMAKMKHKKRF